MTKYVVIEVADREINELIFGNINDAKDCLREAYMEICYDYKLNLNDENECWIGDDSMIAYANKNSGCYNWDWKIIEV